MTRRELEAAIRAKSCGGCGASFATQSDTLAHMFENHAVMETTPHGPVTLIREILPPYSKRERSPLIHSYLTYNGARITEADWQAESFAEGVEWAVDNL